MPGFTVRPRRPYSFCYLSRGALRYSSLYGEINIMVDLMMIPLLLYLCSELCFFTSIYDGTLLLFTVGWTVLPPLRESGLLTPGGGVV